MHYKYRGLLVNWVVVEITSNIMRLIANKVTPGLGFTSSNCRPKMRLKYIIALGFILFSFLYLQSGYPTLSKL